MPAQTKYSVSMKTVFQLDLIAQTTKGVIFFSPPSRSYKPTVVSYPLPPDTFSNSKQSARCKVMHRLVSEPKMTHGESNSSGKSVTGLKMWGCCISSDLCLTNWHQKGSSHLKEEEVESKKKQDRLNLRCWQASQLSNAVSFQSTDFQINARRHSAAIFRAVT